MITVADVKDVLEAFVDDLYKCVDTHRLEDLLLGRDNLKGADVGSRPESWTRKHLIRKLLDVAELEWEPEIHGKGEGYPDFGLTNLEVLVIGEDKSINKIDEAVDDIKKYLNNRAASRGAEYGIATDGIEWIVYRIELGGDYLDYSIIAHINFRNVLKKIAIDKNYIAQKTLVVIDIDPILGHFLEIFSKEKFNKLLTQDAPKEIRNRKKSSIEDFYDLYVELLFGVGKKNYGYETTLLDDIKTPYGVTEIDKKKFAIKLVNRLLFIKFLEDRGVLPDNFLIRRVDNYKKIVDEIEKVGGGLYKSQLEPMFFNLFNTPFENRILKHKGGWFDEVPYLNGSLFEPDNKEKEYDVDDRMLINVIKDLIEGHKLERNTNSGSFDPSLLGNVFEMTINYISGTINAQKEEGAYYTPNDVIKIITEQTVLPKTYDILVDVYSKKLRENSPELDEKTAKKFVNKYKLGEILKFIENREGYFSDPDTITEVYNKLGNLKIVDPACGSGHFLTAALSEIHRVRLSLLRGKKGTPLSPKDIYDSKKELVLNSIYGVDINPIAIEIAKLRVWLKMVEEGWEKEFGELPNININIIDGNSLIGLPARSGGQSFLKRFDVDLKEIMDVRQSYKDGVINRRELTEKIKELRPELDNIFIDNLNHYFFDIIDNLNYFDEIITQFKKPFPFIKSIKVSKINNDCFKEDEIEQLKKIGFSVFKKSARIRGKIINDCIENIKELLSQEFLLELERKSTLVDVNKLKELEELSYKPFHWMIEFPEATINNTDFETNFDIVIGNPPYGDILNLIEKRFVKGYQTGILNEIAFQFIERELQLCKKNGYLGNVATLRFVYQDTASVVRDLLRKYLKDIKIACFARRPSKIFDSSDPRVAIITGIKKEDVDYLSDILTSTYIRFNEDDREKRMKNISYESTNELYLGKKIGSGEDYALPKVGNTIIRNILLKLKNKSEIVFRDVSSRDINKKSEYVIWRRRGPEYWINPFLENLYGSGNEPTDFDPIYFQSEIESRIAFLIMQSSLFYMCWMVYGDQRHLNWNFVDSFPFPNTELIKEHSDTIVALSNKIWNGMKERFDISAGVKGEIKNMSELKDIIDDVDEFVGLMYELSDDEISYVKKYDINYRT